MVVDHFNFFTIDSEVSNYMLQLNDFVRMMILVNRNNTKYSIEVQTLVQFYVW